MKKKINRKSKFTNNHHKNLFKYLKEICKN
jgi:hypothetical protein